MVDTCRYLLPTHPPYRIQGNSQRFSIWSQENVILSMFGVILSMFDVKFIMIKDSMANIQEPESSSMVRCKQILIIPCKKTTRTLNAQPGVAAHVCVTLQRLGKRNKLIHLLGRDLTFVYCSEVFLLLVSERALWKFR